MQEELRAYLRHVKHKYQTYKIQPTDRFDPTTIELTSASYAQIGVILGDAQRIAGRMDQASATYRDAYLRGVRDPALLAGLAAAERAALAHNALVGSAGEGRIASAARADYAAAAVVALTGGAKLNHTYELAGDSAYTLAELAAEISRQTGKSIPYVNLPESEYAGILLKAGLPAPLAHGLASWDASAAQGALYDEGRELSRLIGRATTPLRDAVATALRR